MYSDALQPRLSFTANATEMLLMFTSNSAYSPPQVRLGTSPQSLSIVFSGTSAEPYTASGTDVHT
jgi:hypothetical protein